MNWPMIDLSQVHLVLATAVAGGAIIGAGAKYWKKRPRPLKRISRALDTLEDIKHEFHPNGGSSLRDVVNAILATQSAQEQRLTMSAVLLRRVASSMEQVVLFESDASGAAIWISDFWEDLTGMPVGEALGHGWAGAIHEDDRMRVMTEFKSANEQQRVFRCIFRVQNVADGTVTTVRTISQPVLSNKGDYVIGWIGMTTLVQ